MTAPQRVSLQTEVIELGALLKWTGLVPTGGAAKHLIQRGAVRVNGTPERRRRRRIRPGDRVEVGGQVVLIEGAPVR